MSPDLQLALRLADAADQISSPAFRSSSLQVTKKADGSPVTDVDPAVERAMQAIVWAERPGDSFLGEEIGASGSGPRRWIFDGIDGTHNYAAGRPQWATMIALEVDGEITVGVVSSPCGGVRWYAERGFGAWRVTTDVVENVVTTFAGLEPTRLNCTTAPLLHDANVVAVPPAGLLLGWRSDLAEALQRVPLTRPGTYAYFGAEVAAGDLDATVILYGGPWDFAANIIIVHEAGGDCFDIWGGTSLETTGMIFTNGKLTEEMLRIAAEHRPDAPDAAVRNPNWRASKGVHAP